MGLLGRLLGRREEKTPQSVGSPRREDFQELEVKYQQGEYSVPSPIREDGLYAIQIAQSEMYDLGNIAFISHFLVYDRKERIAVDITSDVKSAPLLSQTRPVEVCTNEEDIETLEEYLTGRTKPQFEEDFPQGIKSFRATELSKESYETVRTKLVALRTARASLDSAVEGFRTEIPDLKTRYFPAVETANSDL
jgi:hypothetical protein